MTGDGVKRGKLAFSGVPRTVIVLGLASFFTDLSSGLTLQPFTIFFPWPIIKP